MTTSKSTFSFQPTLLTHPFPYLSSDSSRILHVKGWASRLSHDGEAPVGLEALMTDFDVFAFDGDDLKSDSFTKFLAVMVCRRLVQPRSRPAALWAIKYNAELEGFLTSWTDSQTLLCGDEITTITVSLPPPPPPPATTIDTHEPNHVTIPLYYTCIDAVDARIISTDDDPEQHYRYLGEQGLAFTQAVHVATIGGGAQYNQHYDLSLTHHPTLSLTHSPTVHPYSRLHH